LFNPKTTNFKAFSSWKTEEETMSPTPKLTSEG